MSVSLAEWLDGFGLRGCHAALAAQAVDLDVLPDLTERDLEQLGLSLGERKRLLRAAATLGRPALAARASGGAAERRRLTVMFSDLAGSTDLAGRLDPEEFHDVVSAHLDAVAAAITRFGGFIARYQGDGVLAYFGWPRASDNDAQRAASAALAMLKDVSEVAAPVRLKLRIGMATGLVVVGDIIGEGAAREVVVSGGAANLAARLQSAASPGTALIAGETRALLGHAFQASAQPPLALKGFAENVTAWRLLAERHGAAASAPARPEVNRMLAREADLAWLGEQWQAAVAGTLRVALLHGEAGIGKSRLTESFAASIGEPHTQLRARALQRHANSSLYPAAGLLRELARIEAGDSDDTALARLAALLADGADADADGGAARSRQALLAAMLDLPADETALDPDPRQRKAELLATMAELIARGARRQPLLLVIEDVHWADATTLELIGLVARRLATAPALILLIGRPEFQPGWDGVAVTARTIGPLPQAASATLIEQVAGKPLPPEVTEAILRRGDGVPLFIEEVTRSVLESGCLEAGEQGWRLVQPLAATDIPATLHDSLIARIDRLGWVKELCQIGAVIGRNFPPELVRALSRHEPHQLEAGLRQLVSSGLVSERGAAPGVQYSFRHALVHDAVYGSLLNSTRRDLHGRVAAVIVAQFPDLARREPEVLAQHYSEARAHDEAAAWLQRAGERDVRRAANREAVTHFTRALDELHRCPAGRARDMQELAIRRALSTAQIGVYGYTGETLRQNVEQALAVSERLNEPGQLLAPMVAHLGGIYSRGEMTQALRLGEQLLRVAGRGGQRGQRMAAHRLLGMAMIGAGDLRAAEAELHASLALARPQQDAERLPREPLDRMVSALGYLSLVEHLLGRDAAALATDARAQERAAALGHPGTQVHAATLRACLLVLRGDDAALAETTASLAAAAQRQGSHPARIAAETLRRLAEAAISPQQAAFEAIGRGRAELRAIGWNVLVAWTSHKEIEVHLALGRDAAARAVLDELTAMLTPRGYDLFRAACLCQRAELARRAGDGAAALRCFGEAEAVARQQGAVFWQDRAARGMLAAQAELERTLPKAQEAAA